MTKHYYKINMTRFNCEVTADKINVDNVDKHNSFDKFAFCFIESGFIVFNSVKDIFFKLGSYPRVFKTDFKFFTFIFSSVIFFAFLETSCNNNSLSFICNVSFLAPYKLLMPSISRIARFILPS